MSSTSPPKQPDVGDVEPRGWIALHRKLRDHPRYKDSEFVHVWIHLLLGATHKPHRVIWNGKERMLQPGQLITGRHAIERDTGVHASKVKRVLALLKSDQQIDQQTCNKSSIITVLNWAKYQFRDQQNGQPATSQRPASDQPATTNNNGENGENGKNGGQSASLPDCSLQSSETVKQSEAEREHQPQAVTKAEAELMESIAAAVGPKDMEDWGGDWRANFVRKHPVETANILRQYHALKKEGHHFESPGKWLRHMIPRHVEERKAAASRIQQVTTQPERADN